MHRNEVIGFLSGYRTRSTDPRCKKDVFLITDCNPCNAVAIDEAANSDLSRNVEMDPESATQQVKLIE
jgi:hypothetical protein